MKKSNMIGQCILIAGGALLLQSIPSFANEELAPPSGRMEEHSRSFDWVQHTQRTLDELKGKLNLTPEQITAWDTWSRGVIKDARQLVEFKKSAHAEKVSAMKPASDGTTPEQMERGIERLRAQTNWMQEHLVLLEAAHTRTAAFYNALSTNQKTIFDLFWHEMYHKVSGHDDGWSMPEREGDGRQ